jgi:hypothetical protein
LSGASGRRPNLVLHVRAPREGMPPAAAITGNRAALRELVDAALEGEGGNASRVFREAEAA